MNSFSLHLMCTFQDKKKLSIFPKKLQECEDYEVIASQAALNLKIACKCIVIITL